MNLTKSRVSSKIEALHIIIRLFLFIMLSNSAVYAQQYPKETVMSKVNYTPPKSLPTYLEPFQDENFNNTITRISDLSLFGGDVIGLVHSYSKRQAWNSDQSLISLSSSNILDGKTYKLLSNNNIGNLGWSNTNPLINYGTSVRSNFLKIYKLDPISFKNNLIFTKTFSNYNVLSHWTSETNLSTDDRYISLYGTRQSSGTDCWVVIYDIKNDLIVTETNIGTPLSNINWISMSQSGDYVLIQYNTRGGGKFEGTKSYDKKLNLLRHLTDINPHGDIGFDQNGKEVWVSNDDNYIRSITLEGNDKEIQYSYVSGGHVSCRNINRPGWAYINDHGDISQPQDYAAFREIFAVKLDEKVTGEVVVNRFTKTYARTNKKYKHEPHASVSPDGTKLIFKSNMEIDTVKKQNYPFSWIVEYKQ